MNIFPTNFIPLIQTVQTVHILFMIYFFRLQSHLLRINEKKYLAKNKDKYFYKLSRLSHIQIKQLQPQN